MMLKPQKTAIVFAVPSLLMAAALFANFFAEGWNWTAPDFALAAVLLFGTAFLINKTVNSRKSFQARLLICLCAAAVMILIWMELAVGIFGSPFAGN